MKKLFTKREVRTASFELDGDEYDFYDALTRYVEDQSIKASEDDSARGRALGFTMAMLQRRFASSVYAVRRSLERMRDKRREDPRRPGEATARSRSSDQLPDDFDDLPEDEQKEIEAELEGRGRLRRPGRPPRGDPAARQAHRSGARARRARDRIEAGQAEEGPLRATTSSTTRR